MGDNIWLNTDADSDANNGNNWSDGLPNATHDLRFSDDSTAANCTLTADLDCNSMNHNIGGGASTYSGTFADGGFALRVHGDKSNVCVKFSDDATYILQGTLYFLDDGAMAGTTRTADLRGEDFNHLTVNFTTNGSNALLPVNFGLMNGNLNVIAHGGVGGTFAFGNITGPYTILGNCTLGDLEVDCFGGWDLIVNGNFSSAANGAGLDFSSPVSIDVVGTAVASSQHISYANFPGTRLQATGCVDDGNNSGIDFLAAQNGSSAFFMFL
jgi:hypothetical protein